MRPIPLPNPLAQYHDGAAFALYAHTPSSTRCGERHDMRFSQADRDLERQLNGRLTNCVRHTVQPRTEHLAHQVVLQKGLAVGLADLRYAQVWMVECGGKTMVARFYDALYIFDDTRAYDIFRHVDDIVAIEVAAYATLAKMQGALIPRFVGYFLTMVAAPSGLEDKFPQRSVQVILLEYIPGDTLLALSPRPLDDACDPKRDTQLTFVCEEHKNAILDAVLLANHLLVLNGVQHLDLEERNVVLKQRPPSPMAFCATVECAMRHRLPTESLIQQLESKVNHDQLVDYSTLTIQQIDSLPIAVIDFGCVLLVEDQVKSMNEAVASFDDGDWYSTDYYVSGSRPERHRYFFYKRWHCSKWLPSTYKYEPGW